jgi:hypothetical protein
VTYYALCVTICLAALLIGFAASAIVCSTAEWIVVRFLRGWAAETRARVIFACRVAPVVLSLGATLLVVLPSFLQWEPLLTTETVGLRLAWLSAMTLGLAGVFCARALRVAISGRHLASAWMERATLLNDFADVYELPDAGALVATVGIVKPRIFVSADVVASLTAQELEAALAHERAHIGSADNFKQLVLRALRLPCSAGDRSWTAGTEIDADLRALQSGASAVELASALVKVARLKTVVQFDACAATCLIPAGHETALADRLRRLKDLLCAAPPVPRRRGWRIAVPGFIACAVAVIALVTQPAILRLTHELIERLV